MFKRLLRRVLISLGRSIGPEEIEKLKVWLQKIEARAKEKLKEAEEKVLPPEPEVKNPDEPVTIGKLTKVIHSSEAREARMSWTIGAIGLVIAAIIDVLLEQKRERRDEKRADARVLTGETDRVDPSIAKADAAAKKKADEEAERLAKEKTKQAWRDKLEAHHLLTGLGIITLGLVIFTLKDLTPDHVVGVIAILVAMALCWILIKLIHHRITNPSTATAKAPLGFPKITWPVAIVLIPAMILISSHLPSGPTIPPRETSKSIRFIAPVNDYGTLIPIKEGWRWVAYSDRPNVHPMVMINSGEYDQREVSLDKYEELGPVHSVRFKSEDGQEFTGRVLEFQL